MYWNTVVDPEGSKVGFGRRGSEPDRSTSLGRRSLKRLTIIVEQWYRNEEK
jgi:hypothetical protein